MSSGRTRFRRPRPDARRRVGAGWRSDARPPQPQPVGPVSLSVPADAALTDLMDDAARRQPAAVLFHRRDRDWAPVTAADFAAEVRALARGLVAAGIRSGERVAVMSRTRYEWTLVDYALWTAAAVSVPVYESSSADQLVWMLGDSGAVAVVCETAQHAGLVASVADRLPMLRRIWQIDGGGLAELTARGDGVADAELADRRAAIGTASLATIVYTSGTTGQPKGCQLTHGNFLSYVRATSELLRPVLAAGRRTLLFLPLAHVLARAVQIGCLAEGVEVAHAPEARTLAADLRAYRPTFLVAVPRVLEKVFFLARDRARERGWWAARLFDAAERTAVAYGRALESGRPPPVLRLRRAVLDLLVYRRLRAGLGGRLEYAISGGAPLAEELARFFRGAGVTVIEGYGLTESCAAGTVNPPGAPRAGTVGRPIPGVELALAADGEVLLRGPQLFRGYLNDPAATAQVLRDGWLHSGDLGELDPDGYLRITGRAKDIIVTAGGKNVSPTALEDRLRAHPLISQVLVVGDGRPYVAALITLDPEALAPWLARRGRPAGLGVAQLREDPDLLAELDAAVATANAAVSRAESIRRFRVLGDDFSEDGGTLTPTLKVRRAAVLRQFADEIDGLYRD